MGTKRMASITIACMGIIGWLAVPGTSPAIAARAALAAPEPNPVPTRWQFDVDIGPLRVAMIDVGSGPRAYLYLTYQVRNATGQDRGLFPSFELSTELGKVHRSGQGVPPAVTRELLRRLDNPFLMDQIGILGLLLQGRENTKEGLVIWPLDDLNVDRIHIYAAGFSGEIKRFTVIDPQTRKPRQIMLRKTLMLRYDTPGELIGKGSTPLPPAQKPRWIMR